MSSIIFLFILLTAKLSLSSECDLWFSKLKIKDTPTCLSKCLSANTDMSTFMCPNQCSLLCKDEENDFTLLKMYGLKEDEIKYCEKNKVECIKAYKLSWNAENLCLKIYPRSSVNDESDACRHYIWSMLMARELDLNIAESILNAHENNPKEPTDEKAMDLSNNRLGLLQYIKFKEKPTNEEIVS